MDGAPNRTALVRELCSVCSEPSNQRCRRCARPLCDEHEPDPDRRCDSCEQGYELARRNHRTEIGLPAFVAFLVALAGLIVLSIPAVSIFGVAFSVLMVVVGAIAVPTLFGRVILPAVIGAREDRARKLFLAEKPKQPLLPPAK